MTYVLAFVVLLLAVAVVVLFAMLGELSARVGGSSDTTATVDEALLGRQARTWPPALAELASTPDVLLLVLSSSCASCSRIAVQLRENTRPLPGYATGLVLSAPDEVRAEEFIRLYDLPMTTTHVDLDGAWVTGNFGIQTSPAALVLHEGRLTQAIAFTDVAALPRAVSAPRHSHEDFTVSKPARRQAE